MKTKKRETMPTTIVRLPSTYLERAKEIAAMEIRSLSSLLRKLIIEGIDQHDKRGKK